MGRIGDRAGVAAVVQESDDVFDIEQTCKRLEAWRGKAGAGSSAAMRTVLQQKRTKTSKRPSGRCGPDRGVL